jgi:hypothetical protein
MKKRSSNPLFVLSLSLGMLVSASVIAQAPTPTLPPPDRVQLEKRLESVRTLLEKSSAAKQIENSNDPAAQTQKAKAMELWKQAKSALDQGDLAAAQKLLIEAPKVMFAAARLAAPEQLLGEKVKADYNNRRESVKALLTAQKRISEEKGNVSGAAQAAKDIENMLAEADQLASSGRYEQARAVVDKAYLVAKASVGSMRSGDTLVRSLNFANKEEEYKYELDRNDTHLMLIKVLVDQQGRGNSMIDNLVKKAAGIREQAEKTAAGGDHQAGIKLLEDSTADLVRAIRSAGIYIPG